jgi:transcriptional regulator with PAS, ATPase and Fis domain
MDRHNRGLHREAQLRSDVLGAYQAYSWPGNLRQLEEAVLHQVLADGRPV